MTVIRLSLQVALVATLCSLPFGIAVAWIIDRSRWPGRAILHTLVLLPLVLPPVVTGYLLLLLFSPRGWIGRAFPVAFTWMGAAVAAAVVGFPLLVMNISLALKAIDPRYETVSRSLGLGPWRTFMRVTLPLAWPGILSGLILAFVRGLGEFGATIVLAGRIPGETETIPLRIYALLEMPEGESAALLLTALTVGICFVAVLLARALDARYRRKLELER